LRTGLRKKDKSKYWDTKESNTGQWESKRVSEGSWRWNAAFLVPVALAVVIGSLLILKLARSSKAQLAVTDSIEDQILIAARADLERKLQARKTVESFLACKNLAEMGKYVCNRARVIPLMEAYYKAHPIPTALPLDHIKVGSTKLKFPTSVPYWYCATKPSTFTPFNGPGFVLRDCGDHFEIDWECLVGFNEMTLAEYLEKRPAEPVVFRLVAKRSGYYNYEFSNSGAYQAFELSMMGESDYVVGYAERNGFGDGMAERLDLLTTNAPTGAPVILKMQLSKSGQNLVRVIELVQDHWISEE